MSPVVFRANAGDGAGRGTTIDRAAGKALQDTSGAETSSLKEKVRIVVILVSKIRCNAFRNG